LERLYGITILVSSYPIQALHTSLTSSLKEPSYGPERTAFLSLSTGKKVQSTRILYAQDTGSDGSCI
jgi:hypothetical protein